MNSFLDDLRHGFRFLRKHPAFTLVIVLTLALGIGANTAIFSVVRTILIRPLPYSTADRLVVVWQPNIKKGWEHQAFTPGDFSDLREQIRTLEFVTSWRIWFHTLGETQNSEEVLGVRTTCDFFRAHGIEPFLGRTFVGEDEREGKDRVVILTHRLWQRRYGGDPQILGSTVRIDDRPFTVIGILPESFRFMKFFLGNDYEIWMPLTLDQQRDNRRDHSVSAFALLAPGASLEEAQAEADNLGKQLAADYPATHKDLGIRVEKPIRYTNRLKASLLILTAAVGGVLLIACTNVANLQLSWLATQRRETVLRLALGAGRLRMIRQLLTESLILALLGGVAGLLFAYFCIDLFIFMAPANFPRLDEIRIDDAVLAFTALITVGVALLSGLVPALRNSAADLTDWLKEGGRTPTLGLRGRSIQSFLVMFQVGLTLMLLVGTGLMIKSYLNLMRIDRGVRTEGVLTAQIWLPKSKFRERYQVSDFYREVLQEVNSLPQIRLASAISFLPHMNWGVGVTFEVEGRPPSEPDERLSSDYRVVDPDCFRTLGIPLLRGRYLRAQDGPDTPSVVVIDGHAARRFWPDSDPIGQRIKFKLPHTTSPWDAQLTNSWLTVVGIVGSVDEKGIVDEERFWPRLYLPYSQNPSNLMSLVVRTDSEPLALSQALRKAVRSVDPTQPISYVMPMDGVISRSLWDSRVHTLLLVSLGILALILALVGIYAVASHWVTHRTHELGVRMAMGARPRHILRMILSQALLLALMGIGLGLIGSLVLGNASSSLLFGVTAYDLATLVQVSILLLIVVLAGCYLPARRATKVDPLTALRYE